MILQMLLTRLLAAIAIASILLTACYKPPAGWNRPVATQASQPIKPPTPEVVTIDFAIDLGPFAPRALGVFRPSPSIEPPIDMLAGLRPLLPDQIPVLVSINQKAKWDGAFPGQGGKWDKWELEVRKLVGEMRSQGRPILWEVWDEPDNRNNFKGNQAEFFTTWIHTWRIIKSIDPRAEMIGPSISRFDHGWIQEFLKIGKEHGVPADVVSWHQDTHKGEMPGNVTGISENFWQDGLGQTRILISPSARIARNYAASDPALFLAGMQNAHRENAWRLVDEKYLFKLSHLVDKDAQPRSVAYVYETYARLSGNLVKVSASSTADGLAVWDDTRKTATIILGRNRGRSGTTRPVLAELSLLVKNIPGGAARVTLQPIPDSGDKALELLPPPTSRNIDCSSGEFKIPLTMLNHAQANIITLEIAGQPSPATKPTSRPAPPVVITSDN